MSMESKLIPKLLCTLLLLHHGLQKTSAITQFKPQQLQAQAKAQQMQPHMQAQQQMQQQQQQQAVQQQAQPTGVPSAADMHEKDITQEVLLKDANQESDLTNTYKMLNEIKRESQHSPAMVPAPSLPTSPLPSSAWSPNPFPSSAWYPNPFMNQNFAAPPPYAPQSYPLLNYAMSPFSANPYSTNPYQTMPFFGTPKFFPFMGYPQPMFMPYPSFLTPDYFYAPFSAAANAFEETQSRAASGRRPPLTNGRDSPIYYMRLPPTPYMFLPNFGYSTNQNGPPLNYGANFPPIIPFPSIPNFPSFGQTFNLPVNFLANGKPTGIHSFLPDIQNSSPFPNFNGFNPRPFAPPPSGNYFQPPYNSPPIPPPYHDSKLTSLKQPFFFNGRPEDIYVLQNSLNPLFSGL